MSDLDFEKYLHPEFTDLCKFLKRKGFKPCLVGGTVRDYFLGIKNKHDYDIELRAFDSKVSREEEFFNLDYPKNFKVIELSFGVIRLKGQNIECELTLPRLEIFNEDEFHHHNFKVKYISDLDFKESFLRRDFTVNAMMMVLDETWHLIDPLDGRKHLVEKILYPCSRNFKKDPVRFLRAIRFSIKFDFTLSSEIKDWLMEINFDDLPISFIKTEGIKSRRPALYLVKLLKNVKDKVLFEEVEKLLEKYEQMDLSLSAHLKQFEFFPLKFLDFLGKSFEVKLTKHDFDFDLIRNIEVRLWKNESQLKLVSDLLKLSERELEMRLYFFDAQNLLDTLFQLKKIKVDVSDLSPAERNLMQVRRKLDHFLCELK